MRQKPIGQQSRRLEISDSPNFAPTSWPQKVPSDHCLKHFRNLGNISTVRHTHCQQELVHRTYSEKVKLQEIQTS